MAGITLEQAEAQLALWIQADADLAQGQRVVIGGEEVSRIDTTAKIDYWDRRVRRLSQTSSGIKMGRVVISD